MVSRRVDQHYRRPPERPFTRAERDRATCLFVGLTRRQNALIRAAMAGMGYKAGVIPTPTKADFQTGKECCNPGMCNPAYFTAGALINFLKRLRDEQGLSAQQVLDDYLFVTAGSCGPCRFGMYESEYRLGLRNSGFDGFRVLVFQEKGGLRQSGAEAGLGIDATFAAGLLSGLMIGDLLNDLAHQIRPYEVIPGCTNRVLDNVLDRMCEVLRGMYRARPRVGVPARILGRFLGRIDPAGVQRILDQLYGNEHVAALAECARVIEDEIEVDYTRPKPLCKIVGEVWAQTTEGDGNFRMFSFLESQGAEAQAEPMMTWANYLLDSGARKLLDEREAFRPEDGLSRWRRRRASHRRLWLMRLAAKAINREYERLRLALRGLPHPQVDPGELRRVAGPFFNYKITGGEGHLEVGKTIHYSSRGLAHLVLSLKPFGCLPSTQSDGVQAAVVARYAGQGRPVHFLPLETSGEGDISAYSRVQMALGDAKTRCSREFESCVNKTGRSLASIRQFCKEHRELRSPFQCISRHDGVAGRAANFVLDVASKMAAVPERVQQETVVGAPSSALNAMALERTET